MKFFNNPEYGKSREQLDREIREVTAETRKRTNNGLDTEDQDARRDNLREARDRQN